MKRQTILTLLVVLLVAGMLVVAVDPVAAATGVAPSDADLSDAKAPEDTVELENTGDSRLLPAHMGERLLPASFNMEPVDASPLSTVVAEDPENDRFFVVLSMEAGGEYELT